MIPTQGSSHEIEIEANSLETTQQIADTFHQSIKVVIDYRTKHVKYRLPVQVTEV